jgi:hypothetical protein
MMVINHFSTTKEMLNSSRFFPLCFSFFDYPQDGYKMSLNWKWLLRNGTDGQATHNMPLKVTNHKHLDLWAGRFRHPAHMRKHGRFAMPVFHRVSMDSLKFQ